MIQIDNTLVSLDVIEKMFVCNLFRCRGMCCVHGESGAPLEGEEADILTKLLPVIRPYLRPEGLAAIDEQGTSMIDSDGDLVTPLIQNRECAYTVIENGIYKCGIEKAYYGRKIAFRKPVSCHLYPVRIRKYEAYDAVNFEYWSHCNLAVEKGEETGTPVYVFLKDALIRKYGRKWFGKLVTAAHKYIKTKQLK
ncbi:MAG: DUF3109 family protein [Chlorobi bacterium]|nr:DUF3109 family protein [Chlorobiota bacterium]